ncbi:hypothetical protein [Streptomyces sp. Ag109_O5-10]|uniref:hypothetical protein n=1 Tax=Streptomyces sp. Ag109_O5-10 TaxID=1855349 RepID=UPI000B8846E4
MTALRDDHGLASAHLLGLMKAMSSWAAPTCRAAPTVGGGVRSERAVHIGTKAVTTTELLADRAAVREAAASGASGTPVDGLVALPAGHHLGFPRQVRERPSRPLSPSCGELEGR